MKKLFTLTILACMTLFVSAQTVTGVVVDPSSGDPLIGATVIEKGTTNGTITDIDGKFSIVITEPGEPVLLVSFLGYNPQEVSVMGDGNVSLGNIELAPDGLGLDEVVITGTMDIVRDRKTPVAVSTIGVREIQAKAVGNVEFPEVMKNTPSVYVSSQTGFGDSQMWMRGFDQINTAFLLNGQPINGMEDGRMYWSNWSGMSDVATAVQVQRGLGSSKLAISSVGGTVNIVTKTVENQQGGFARFMVGNDGYLKGTLAYNSGLVGKWAVSALVDHWQADRKWAEGTFGQGQSYFLSVGFKPNERNTFNFLVTGAPQNHGQRWSQSLETLEEDPKFNQHWGLDSDGNILSERYNYYHKPVMNLIWDFDIDERTTLSSVLYASFGRGGGTGDYGRGRIRTEEGQVDFAAIEASQSGIGSFGDNYARRASVNNHQWYGNVTTFKKNLSPDVDVSVGADVRFYRGDHFRQIVNYFGLSGWNESFRHATRPSDYVVNESYSVNPWAALTNFAPEGQRIAYDYSENINYQGAFGQLEYTPGNASTFIQGSVSNQFYQREGRWSDIGKSDSVNKLGYNVKAGASYSFDLSNIIFFNAGFYSRQPFLDNIFENIRYSNDFIEPEIENENVIGLELGYKLFLESFAANINLYNTNWGNRTNVSTFNNDAGTPDDESDDFAQRNIERGISQVHRGIEIDMRYDFLNGFLLKGYASFGDWKYTAIDRVTVFNDDTGALIGEEDGSDLSDVHVPNAPQTSFGIGASYRWNGISFFADYNYYDRLFQRNNFNSSETFLREEIGTLDPYSLIDAGVGYRFNIGESGLELRANVYNVLDSFYINQTDPFGFLNGNGRTWNLSLKYIF
ncbi:TonB-dependent receptor [Portibacter marinus]|uniref:TonB-dependent receptor n=1 Tax=Portibacter marinus TaxID=2898660 RepID=UPI001F1B0E9C|nr:carboxypeptidase-like regulatory domain-containing protein [Portibacter marinus]